MEPKPRKFIQLFFMTLLNAKWRPKSAQFKERQRPSKSQLRSGVHDVSS